jgi:hypothetical protein
MLLLIPVCVAGRQFLMCRSYRTMICLLMVSRVRTMFNFFIKPTSSFSWIFCRYKEILKIHKFRQYVLEFSCWIALFPQMQNFHTCLYLSIFFSLNLLQNKGWHFEGWSVLRLLPSGIELLADTFEGVKTANMFFYFLFVAGSLQGCIRYCFVICD